MYADRSGGSARRLATWMIEIGSDGADHRRDDVEQEHARPHAADERQQAEQAQCRSGRRPSLSTISAPPSTTVHADAPVSGAAAAARAMPMGMCSRLVTPPRRGQRGT